MNNLQVTKLKVGKVEPAKIEWNGKEIKESLNLALEDYRNLVVTEDVLKGSKEMMAFLNKEAEKIEDFRKTTVKMLNPDIKKLETEAKELVSMIKEARGIIKDQVEVFLEKQREEKRKLVNYRIDALNREYELEKEFEREIELKDQYLNATLTLNKIEQDLRLQYDKALQLQKMKHQKIDTIKIIVETYNDQLEFKFDAEEFDYLLEYDIAHISNVVKQKVLGRLEQEKETRERLAREKQEAIERAQREAEERVRREEEAKRIEEEKRHQEEIRQAEFKADSERRQAETNQKVMLQEISQQIDNIVPVEEEEETPRVEYSFSAKGTINQIEALKRYMDQYNVEWEELF